MTQHSDDDDDAPAHGAKAGEGWVVTFADMMSLLMSFFVLLLSFSEQDQAKFKEVGGSLENAFGVQRDIVAYQMPKGTSIVAREFSPGKPRPTASNEVKQSSIDDLDQTLEFDPKDHADHKKKLEDDRESADNAQSRRQRALAISNDLSKDFQTEIKDGKLKILTKDQRVIIRILDQGSFASGDDSLHPAFLPVLNKMAYLINEMPGKITISGHTDDRPISNSRFKSNWELSAARAITVAQHLYDRGVDKDRIIVSGNAASDPIAPNDTEANRSQNRRVEITLTQDDLPRVQEAPEVVPSYLRKQIQQPPREIVVNSPKLKKNSSTNPPVKTKGAQTTNDQIKTTTKQTQTGKVGKEQ